ncbi:MAG: hypothetical protein LBQ01_03735, partial [Prevotellaceae bacterium]|nr:hypothetical protein [Prevotellaceae bacterium]
KIYASEQIRRAEKYIGIREENEGYRKRIVEIAVEYQIDSKYTAFIAINERDEKITDIPELQDTVLESPAGWDMMNMRLPRVNYGSSLFACKKYSFMSDDFDMKPSVDIDALFENTVKCEELINQNDSYQALLDEIADELRPHFLSPSRKYRKLFRKMEKKTPKVYALIKAVFDGEKQQAEKAGVKILRSLFKFIGMKNK